MRNHAAPIVLSSSAAFPQLSMPLDEECIQFNQAYEQFRERVRNGFLGKTPQFWMICLDLMQYQHKMHIAIHENNFDQKVLFWKQFIPFYFALNKINYARYGSNYVEVLNNIDRLYPGMRQSLPIWVQAQDRYPVRTSIDQRGEQSINRDAKTSGGIKNIAKDWCCFEVVLEQSRASQ